MGLDSTVSFNALSLLGVDGILLRISNAPRTRPNSASVLSSLNIADLLYVLISLERPPVVPLFIIGLAI